jgi:Predicted AAA-ATPase/PD-(D/E)XK nuclease superfamily
MIVENTPFNNSKPSIIGYAQADFATLRAQNKLYIDRTMYIQVIENTSNSNLIFVRPRRFGKSLWLSVLNYYYGVQYKDQFTALFGDLAVGKNPTPLRNSYVVLQFQFSGISVETDETIFYGFRQNVLNGIRACMENYPAYFTENDLAQIEALDTPEAMVQLFFTIFKGKNLPYKIYLLIDEYDQFANELVGVDAERFQSIIGRSGFVRKFYEMIKAAANVGIVNRFFATGVSPLTVDAMTSGFNITSSISLELDFHDLMGFRAAEVMEILRKVGASEAAIPAIMLDLKAWYNGYLFHAKATERLYNSDMVMYFAAHYEKKQAYPEVMLDANIATDYTKVKRIFSIQQREKEFIPVLKELTTEGSVTAQITQFFNLERPFSRYDLVSLLYYMGWITIKDFQDGRHIFQMPNYVIEELYYNYFVDIVERELGLNETVPKIQDALSALSQRNNPQPFLTLIKTLIDSELSLRDAQGFDEKHLKMLLIPFLSLSATHYVVSEPEWTNGYPDLLLMKRPNIETRYNFVFELKYLRKSDKNKRVIPSDKTSEKIVDKAAREARTQLTEYLQTDVAKRIPSLKAWVIVLVGREWKIVEEVPVL